MFYIQFSPIESAEAELLTLEVSKDVLTVNGVDLDFTPLKDGDMLSANAVGHDSVLGVVSRVEGDIQITLQMPYRQGSPEFVKYPDPVIVSEDGKVKVPTDFMEGIQ